MKTVNRYIALAGLLLSVLAATAQQTHTLKVKNMPENLAALMELPYWGDVGSNHYYSSQLTEGIQVEAGQTITLYTYDFRYYVKFLKWTVDGTETKDALTTEGYRMLTLTMPDHDVDVEVWMKYQPDSPDEPEVAPTACTLKVVSQAGSNLRINIGKIAYNNFEAWSGLAWEMPNPRGQYYWPEYYPIVGVLPGDTVAVYIEADNYGWRFSHLEMDGKRVFEGHMTTSGEREDWRIYTMVMPDHDVTLYAYGSYDPDAPDMEYNSGAGLGNNESPGNPGTNSWSAATGELFINNLVKKRANNYNNTLGGAVAELMDEYGFQQSDVRRLTLVGDVSSGTDFGNYSEYTYLTQQLASINNMTALETLDLSNTKNLSQLPEGLTFNDETPVTSNMLNSLEINEMPSIKHLILPACLRGLYGSWINDNHNMYVRRGIFFRPLTGLEDLTLYAVAPPKVEQGTMDYLPEGVVLYVPEQSVAAYKADTAWCRIKDIRPIPVPDARNATVALPADWSDGRYQGMSLCLINVLTDDVRRYVVDERNAYLYRSIPRGANLVAQLRTVKDDIIAETDTMAVGDEQLEMEFKRMRLLHDLQLKVQTPGETDITNMVEVTWTDSKGSRLSFTPELQKQIDGTFVYYTLKLPRQLAGYYVQPPTTEVIVGLGSDDITVTLALMDSVTVNGTVRDMAGNRIGGATVTVTQLLNGAVGKTFNTTTDANGRYELKALAGQAAVSATATGYAPQRQELTLTALQSQTADLQLPALEGAIVKFSLSYTPSVVEGGTAEEQPCYTDFRNVAISAYNETTSLALDSLTVQHPEIIILDGAKAGDRIRLTATSLTGDFAPASVTATLNNEKRDEISFHLVERGGMQVSFAQTDNKAVTASLYDADGHLYDVYPFSEASQTITGLDEGKYTVVTMAKSTLYGKLEQLNQYEAVGLQAGRDYVQNEVTVKPGTYTKVHNETIPVFDESAYYYTQSDSTTLNMNKTEVTIGQNVTLRAQVCFKPEYRDLVSNVQLLIDLSPNATPVEGACMTGTHIVTTSTEGNGRIVIPVATSDLDKMTRIVVTAINRGSLLSTAYVRFNLGDKQLTQPIGTINCTVNTGTINFPSRIYNPNIYVSGTAGSHDRVTLYVSETEMAQTMANAAGEWSMDIELPEMSNLARMPIYADIQQSSGLRYQTETKYCSYNNNAIRVEHVYMYYAEARYSWGDTGVIHFDFTNPASLDDQYFVTRSHGTDHYTYKILFNRNDTTMISNVLLAVKYMDNSEEFYPATYNKTEQCWIANAEGFWSNPPVNVDVEFSTNENNDADADMMYAMTHLMEGISDQAKVLHEEVSRIVAAIQEETDNQKRRALLDELSALVGFDTSAIDWSIPSDKTLDEALIDTGTLLASIWSLDEIFSSMDIYNADWGEGVAVKHAGVTDSQQLVNDGFRALHATDGNLFFYKATDEMMIYIDTANDFRLEVIPPVDGPARRRNIRDPNEWKKWHDLIADYITKINVSIEATKQGTDALRKVILPWLYDCEKEYNTLYKIIATSKAADVSAKDLKLLAKLAENKAFLEGLNKCLFNLKNFGLNAKNWFDNLSFVTDKGIGKTIKGCLKKMGGISNVLSWTTLISDLWDGIDKGLKLRNMYDDVPEPCEDDQAAATQLQNDIDYFYGTQLVLYTGIAIADAANIELIKKGIIAAAPTFGASLVATLTGIIGTLVKMGTMEANNWQFESNMQQYVTRLNMLECDKDPEKDKERIRRLHQLRKEQINNRTGKPYSTFRDMKSGIDPSGYVYEAVADNRVEGATATIYFRQTGEDEWGDQHDEAVMWNAAEMGQKNPLLTDAEGKYAWDVPKGLWQVKIEKDGYLPATSEWLPVPPPQLDINIGLVQNALPQVASARAYEDAIEVEFNKYMRPNTLTTDNIWMVKDGQKLPVRISMENQGQAYDSDQAYVSRIQVWPDDGTTMIVGETVSLAVAHQVESYAGIQMQEDYLQEFVVARAIRELSVDTLIEVPLDGERTFTVMARPAAAAAGQRLTTAITIGSIATVEGEATFDDNGMARLTVKGLMGGYTQLALAAEGSRAAAQTMIQVMDPSLIPTATPTASRISGTSVRKGDTVELFCDTEGATIWYTLDGTCPCDENGPRQAYTGPITLSGDDSVTLKAYAVKEGQQESRVATYTYYLLPAVMADTNGDGELNIADIVEAINYINGKPSKHFNKTAADTNSDNKVNIGDILKMVNAIMTEKRTK